MFIIYWLGDFFLKEENDVVTVRKFRVVATLAWIGLAIYFLVAGHLGLAIFLPLMTLGAWGARRRHQSSEEKIDAARGRTRWPKRIGKRLLPIKPNKPVEMAIAEVRSHPISMFSTGRWVLNVLALPAAIVGSLVQWWVGPLIILVAVGFAVKPFLTWWYNMYTITAFDPDNENRGRLIHAHGIINAQTPAVWIKDIDAVTPIEHKVLNAFLQLFGRSPVESYKIESKLQAEPVPIVIMIAVKPLGKFDSFYFLLQRETGPEVKPAG